MPRRPLRRPFKSLLTSNTHHNDTLTTPTAGGGNDVITVRDDCVKFNDRCKAQIDDAMLIAGDLLDKMQREGVQHVLYLGFYKVCSVVAVLYLLSPFKGTT